MRKHYNFNKNEMWRDNSPASTRRQRRSKEWSARMRARLWPNPTEAKPARKPRKRVRKAS